MEILHTTLAGLSLQAWAFIACAVWVIYSFHKAIKHHRQTQAQLNAARAEREANYRWKPDVINGVDCGEWVPK